MLKRFCLAAAILALAATPALAENVCGTAPIAPAIPAASDLAGKPVEANRAMVVDAYHQVKAYQASLKPFRDCLLAQANTDKAAMAEALAKPDKPKADSIKQQMDDMQKVYDKTVDTETQVATDFNNLHVADCVNDTDPKICPKKP